MNINKIEGITPGFGPGLAFADSLANIHPGINIGLVPCAKEGSSITQWNHSKKQTTLYASCLARSLTAAKSGIIKGLLWYQGESDTYSAQAASAWPRKFEALVKAFRRDLNLPHLPVVFAQVGKLGGAYAHQAAYNHWETLKRAQEQIDLPHVVMVKADGLETSDGVHLTAASNYELGRIMAEAMDKLAYR